MSNLVDNFSLEDKVNLMAAAVSKLISATQHNKQVDDENYQHVQDMKKTFKELQNTVTRLANTYLIVQDDLAALTTQLEELEAAQKAELGDRK